MKKFVKSYKTFTPGWYRIWRGMLSALIWCGLECLFEFTLELDVFMLAPMFIVSIEVATDYFVFGGINSKEKGNYGFLQSSRDGMKNLKNAVYVDMLRRFLLILLPILMMGVWTCYYLWNDGLFEYYGIRFLKGACYLFYVFGVATWGVFISRFLNRVQQVFSVASISMAIASCINLATIFAPWAVLVIGLLLTVSSVAATIWFTKKKLEGSYYDERT